MTTVNDLTPFAGTIGGGFFVGRDRNTNTDKLYKDARSKPNNHHIS